jgi:hypothetical protein
LRLNLRPFLWPITRSVLQYPYFFKKIACFDLKHLNKSGVNAQRRGNQICANCAVIVFNIGSKLAHKFINIGLYKAIDILIAIVI